MKRNLFYLVILLVASFSFLNISFAQEQEPTPVVPPQEEMTALPAAPPPAQEVKQAPAEAPKEEALKEKTAPPAPAKAETCNCDKPAIEGLDKTYVSLEEDEWASAIKVSTDTLTLIKNLSMTCTCPVIISYQDVAQGFLNYATGGSILDSEEEINCPKAKKLYEDALKLFDGALPKITDENLKKKVKDIRDYAQEEKEFVDDECE